MVGHHRHLLWRSLREPEEWWRTRKGEDDPVLTGDARGREISKSDDGSPSL